MTDQITIIEEVTSVIVDREASIGLQGPQGEEGPIGATGPQGIQGAIGPIGPEGPQGVQGLQGPQGLQGDPGPEGPQGGEGPTGPSGTSIVLMGTVNTVGELPVSANPGEGYVVLSDGDLYFYSVLDGWQSGGQIVGPQGVQGIQGVQGDPGPPGAEGPQGVQGIQGIQGDTGPAGPQGIQGPAGDQGVQGPQGNPGPQGIQGNPGTSFDSVMTTKGDIVVGTGSGTSIVLPAGTSAYHLITNPATASGLEWVPSSATAGAISTDVSGFNGMLSAADTTVQAALNTLDNATSSVATSTVYTTASLADLAVEAGTVALGTTVAISRVSADRACRVRLYANTTYRDADASRAIGVAPGGDHGLLLEVVIPSTQLSYWIAPAVVARAASGSPAILIQNTSGGTSTVAVTFTAIRIEV